METFIIIASLVSFVFVVGGCFLAASDGASKTTLFGTGCLILSSWVAMAAIIMCQRAWYALKLVKNSNFERELTNIFYYDIFNKFRFENGITLKEEIFFRNFLNSEVIHYLMMFGIFFSLANILLAGWAIREKVFE